MGRSDTHTRRVTGLRCVLAYNEFVKDTLFCGRNHERQCGRCAKIYIWLRVKKMTEFGICLLSLFLFLLLWDSKKMDNVS